MNVNTVDTLIKAAVMMMIIFTQMLFQNGNVTSAEKQAAKHTDRLQRNIPKDIKFKLIRRNRNGNTSIDFRGERFR